jgi:hypothetical protein
LVGVLEWEDDWVRREGSEGWVEFLANVSSASYDDSGCRNRSGSSELETYIEEVKLVWICSSNACCEQQKITLQPFDFKRRKLKADTGTCFVAHVDNYIQSSSFLWCPIVLAKVEVTI